MEWLGLGLIIGIALMAMVDYFVLFQTKRGRTILRRFLYQSDGIEFRKMQNPPDEGIDQLLYKPEGEPATVTRNAMRRRGTR